MVTRKTTRKKTTTSSPLDNKPPLSLVIYGPPGIGKTALAARFPKPIFVADPTDEGIIDLVEWNQAPKPQGIKIVKTFQALLRTLRQIADNPGGARSLVIDTLTGMQHLCFAFHCKEYFNGDWSNKGFMNFRQGPANAAEVDWPRFLGALDEVRKKGLHIITLAHQQSRTEEDPEGGEYLKMVPFLEKPIWQETNRWAKGIFYYTHRVRVIKDKGKAKAQSGSGERVLYVSGMDTFTAKNRFGLVGEVDGGESANDTYSNLMEAFNNK